VIDEEYMTDEYNLIFVDCEGHGPAPTLNNEGLFEFGAFAKILEMIKK